MILRLRSLVAIGTYAALLPIFACGESKDTCDKLADYLSELKCSYFSVYRPPTDEQCRSGVLGRCLAGCIVDVRPSCVDLNAPPEPNGSERQLALGLCYQRCAFPDGG